MRRIAVIGIVFALVLAACETDVDTDDANDTEPEDEPTAAETVQGEATAAETPDPTSTPEQETTETPEPVGTTETEATPEATMSTSLEEGCVDINSASEEELREIVHIDEERSADIVELRPFDSVEDLTRVNGIAEQRLEEIQEQGLACVADEGEDD